MTILQRWVTVANFRAAEERWVLYLQVLQKLVVCSSMICSSTTLSPQISHNAPVWPLLWPPPFHWRLVHPNLWLWRRHALWEGHRFLPMNRMDHKSKKRYNGAVIVWLRQRRTSNYKNTSVSLVRNVGVCILSSVWCSPLFFEDMCVFFWCSITKLVHFFATTQHCSKISFEFLFGTISYKKRQQTNVVQEHGPVGPYDRYTWSYNPP